jgi:hypothetical protein
MLKRLIELVIVIAIGYAGWHAGVAYLHYYQFNDAISELALFAGRSSEDQIRERVVQLARQYEIPLDPESLTVHTDEEVTQITAPYTAPVRLLPNYTYEWQLQPKASVVHVR